MKTFRCFVAFAMILILAACGTPPVRPNHLADPDKRKLGTTAFVVNSEDPVYDFDSATKGKGDGAGKGAAGGALESLRCGVLVIVCLPLGLVVGAAVGASQAKSASEMATSNSSVQAEIHGLGVPEKVHGALAAYLKRIGVQSAAPKLALVSQAALAKPDYAAMIGEADSVVEIGDFHLQSYTSGKEGAPLTLALRAHVRIMRTASHQVLDDFETTATPHVRMPEEWLQGGAAGLSESIAFQAKEIAETALDELLLIYHPATMDPAKEKVQGPAPIPPTTIHTDPPPQKELVPGYALRTVSPPFRNKVYSDLAKMNMGHLERYRLPDLQPAFEWEAFPRNFDVTPGSEPGQARNLHYELRVYGKMGIAYERFGLEVPRHKVEVPLAPCEAYRWTARATFDLNGSPRVTEWTGGYSTKFGAVGPWEWRRGKRTSLLFLMPNYSKYPIVTTPASNGGPCSGD